MKKFGLNIISIVLICFSVETYSQTTKCDCEAYFNLENIDYTDSLTKTFYKKIKKLHEDETECLNFKIISDSANYFKIVSNDDITAKAVQPIWVKKTDQFQTMPHYSDESTLVLRESPDYKSKIVKYLKTGYIQTAANPPKLKLTVINCKKNWIKVKMHFGKKLYEGWIRPGGHCPNPCSTCT